MNKTLFYLTGALAALLLALAGCGNSDTTYSHVAHYLPVRLAGSSKWSIINVENGKLIAKDAFKSAPSAVVADMFYVMNEDGTFNYYNVADVKHPVNAEPYGSVTSFSTDGYAVASHKGGPLTIIDAKCNTVRELPLGITDCSMYSRGRAVYHDDMGKSGYIDEKGDTVTGAIYFNAMPFTLEDYAVVNKTDGQDSTYDITVINKQGKEMFSVFSSQYQLMRTQAYFAHGVLPVMKEDSIVFLNHEGKEVPSPVKDPEALKKAGYTVYAMTPNGYYQATNKDGKQGIVDASNKTLVPFNFTFLDDIAPERFVASKKDSTLFLIDAGGKQVGNVNFVDYHNAVDEGFATRGFIDTGIAAAAFIAKFTDYQACGAAKGNTLMDLNGLVGDNPASTLGNNAVAMNDGPIMISFNFDKDLSSLDASGHPTFNYDAKLVCVSMSLDVSFCRNSTEQEIVDKIAAAIGNRGFVLGQDGMFDSDKGTTVAIGYAYGRIMLNYYMDKTYAQPLPRRARG